MAQKLTLNDARESLNAHVTAKGTEIREKYGPIIGWAQLQLILQDRDIVRYPCDLAFEAEPLEPGECAYAHPKGERPEEGFTIYIHPYFLTDPSQIEISATASRAKVLRTFIAPNRHVQGFRAMIDVQTDPGASVEIRAFLHAGPRALTETALIPWIAE